jgi:hypothetical protein
VTDKLYRIKPLVWKHQDDEDCPTMQVAYAPMVHAYSVRQSGKETWWWEVLTEQSISRTPCKTEAEAKAACETHHERLMEQGLVEEGMNPVLKNRIFNWKFASASIYLDGEDDHIKHTVQLLARMFGDCGWLTGDIGSLIQIVVDSLGISPP